MGLLRLVTHGCLEKGACPNITMRLPPPKIKEGSDCHPQTSLSQSHVSVCLEHFKSADELKIKYGVFSALKKFKICKTNQNEYKKAKVYVETINI